MLSTIEGQIARIRDCSPAGVYDRGIKHILMYLLLDANRQETYQEAEALHAAFWEALTSLKDLETLDRKARYCANKGQPYARLVRQELGAHRDRLRAIVKCTEMAEPRLPAQDWGFPELEPVIGYFESIDKAAEIRLPEEEE